MLRIQINEPKKLEESLVSFRYWVRFLSQCILFYMLKFIDDRTNERYLKFHDKITFEECIQMIMSFFSVFGPHFPY